MTIKTKYRSSTEWCSGTKLVISAAWGREICFETKFHVAGLPSCFYFISRKKSSTKHFQLPRKQYLLLKEGGNMWVLRTCWLTASWCQWSWVSGLWNNRALLSFPWMETVRGKTNPVLTDDFLESIPFCISRWLYFLSVLCSPLPTA